MSLPKIAGIETEYGILVRGATEFNPFYASQLLLEACRETKVANGNRNSVQILDDFMLANGSRFYIDHAHPEYCTPEARHPKDIVAADKAGERILQQSCQQANASGILPAGQTLALYKNNSDQKGNSYGCHENYLLSAQLYETLIWEKDLALSQLVPFLVTRSIFCGAGKVSSENNTEPASFQLTQRADFFETLFGLQTTHHRPIINTRDEPHAAQSTYRRLHVIIGDANMSDYSTYLKVGTTQLVLMMLEDSYLDTDFSLKDPITALRTVSRDLSFTQLLPLANGQQATALEIQQAYLQAAKQYIDQLETAQIWQEVIQLWQDSLDRLSQNWRSLSTRFDWAIKRNLLERYLHTQNCDWDMISQWQPIIQATLTLDRPLTDPDAFLYALRTQIPQAPELEAHVQAQHLAWQDYWHQRNLYFTLRRLDLDYHEIAQPVSLFYRLQKQGAIEQLLTAQDIDRFVSHPPLDTRAYLRGYLIEHYANSIQQVNWGEIEFYDRPSDQSYFLILPDLMEGTQAEFSLKSPPRLSELLSLLAQVKTE